PDLLHKGHHVEVLSALLDLVTVELEYPGGGRGLALTRSRKRAGWAVQRPRLCSLPGHLKDRFVAACEGIRDSALDVRHRRSPALEGWKDLGLASKLASRTHLFVETGSQQRHGPVPVRLVERFYCFPGELDKVLVAHDAFSFLYADKPSRAGPAEGSMTGSCNPPLPTASCLNRHNSVKEGPRQDTRYEVREAAGAQGKVRYNGRHSGSASMAAVACATDGSQTAKKSTLRLRPAQ